MRDTKGFDKLREAIRESAKQFESEAESYWEQLPYDDKLKAFFCVVRRIVKAEMVEKTSYRGALYDVFEFDYDAYMIGMQAGYLELHNAVFSSMEKKEDENNKNDGI